MFYEKCPDIRRQPVKSSSQQITTTDIGFTKLASEPIVRGLSPHRADSQRRRDSSRAGRSDSREMGLRLLHGAIESPGQRVPVVSGASTPRPRERDRNVSEAILGQSSERLLPETDPFAQPIPPERADDDLRLCAPRVST